MTLFSKPTQRPEEQPQRAQQGENQFSPVDDQMRQMQNARSFAPAAPSNQVVNPQTPPTAQGALTPNPARQNHGGSQGLGPNPGNNGLGLLQRSKQMVRTQPPAEVEGNNLILHRAQHFLLRTAYRPGQTVAPLRRPTGHTTTMPKIMPEQGDRIASSETHMMPIVTPINPVHTKGRVPVPRWLETIVVMIALAGAGIAHTLNMFNFPRYELDEGTYMSSAYAIMRGQLWPYAYGYGHPPLAWMQIAAWVQLTGGFFTFGNAINSGRVLMLLYSLVSALLVYLIVRRFGASRSAGLFSMVIFALSPLSINYQRQVLLDNIATFWLLVSLYLLVIGNSRLLYIALSAVALGISFLSKEVFVLFMPAMVYAVWLHTTQFQRKFAIVAFAYTMLAVASAFVLLALLKGELFPAGWLPWDRTSHLSLLDTLIGQTKRTQTEGSFAQSLSNWWYGDKLLIAGGILAIAFNLLVGWWNRKQLLLALLAISFWLLLIRGGVVLSFYLIPLIPLMAINAAMAVHTITNWAGKLVRFDIVRPLLVLGVIAAIIPYDIAHAGIIYTQHPTSAQNQAITWVRQNVPHNAFIVINSYLYVDLRAPGGLGVGDGATYPYAHVYQNVATDPAITDGLLGKNPDRIDYIIADSGMINDVRTQPGLYSKTLAVALKSSVVRATFQTPDENNNIVITIYEVKHKNGQPVVSTAPSNRSGSSTNVASNAGGTISMDRRLYIE